MTEFAKAYDPQQVEDRLYTAWQNSGLYRADSRSTRRSFSIVMPPPNITGKLTLGHVLNTTLQDILCRRARMSGCEVLWLPGTDHAGLATQAAVEKHLRRVEQKRRQDFSPDEFLRRIWQWKEEFGGVITQQLRRVGCSCDWSRKRFTLDAGYTQAVQQVFAQLYAEKRIYRGRRMVNWCPGSQTAISDEEVISTPQKGFLYYVRYALIDAAGTVESPHDLIVATTRPETIMADAALAVKPGGRWAHLVGRKVRRPLHEAEIPIIADEAVEEGFGTGILKVTPAHDKTDYAIGLRHALLVRDILTPDGKITDPGEHDAAELHGLDRFAARTRAGELLRERGRLERQEAYENNVGYSERAGVPIEPRLSLQWFLRYPQIDEARELVRTGRVRFHPAHWVKVYEHWLQKIEDWCISRQVAWGHRIPVWYRAEPGVEITEATECSCAIESPGPGWIQETDCLDTWFSSWLWAYATMRVEDGTRAKFYPTSVLVTGPDIIFLWVARMIIAGLHFRPSGTRASEEETQAANRAFHDVYFTGLILDRQGQKLSKSLGNSPDPVELIDKYGADGVRFGLVRIAPQGHDIRFDEKQVEEGRNFCNKLWNIARFRALQGPIEAAAEPFRHKRTIFADELLMRLHRLLEKDDQSVGGALDRFEFSEAAGLIYDFVWNDFAARFVEAAKLDFSRDARSPTRRGTLATFDYVLSHALRLLHPFTPFLTEELWLTLGFGRGTIQTAPWPAGSPMPEELTSRAADLYATADAGRTLRGEVKIASNQKVPFFLELNQVAVVKDELSEDQVAVLSTFLQASSLSLTGAPPVGAGPVTFTPLGKLHLLTAGLDPALERQRLEKELARAEKSLDQERKKLADPQMRLKAPPEKLAAWQANEARLSAEIDSLRSALRALGRT